MYILQMEWCLFGLQKMDDQLKVDLLNDWIFCFQNMEIFSWVGKHPINKENAILHQQLSIIKWTKLLNKLKWTHMICRFRLRSHERHLHGTLKPFLCKSGKLNLHQLNFDTISRKMIIVKILGFSKACVMV